MSTDRIATVADLAALPVGATVGCKGIRTWTREANGMWRSPEDRRNPENSAKLFRGHGGCHMTVLHMPAGTDERDSLHVTAARIEAARIARGGAA